MRSSAAAWSIQRYAHAKQFKRANRMLRKLRTYLGRVIRDIARKIEGNSGLEVAFAQMFHDNDIAQRTPTPSA